MVRDDEWIRAGHRSNPYKSVGGIQTSRGGGAVGVDRKYGSDAFLGKTGGGDVYVGKDGNIYRRTDDGWQSRQEGAWKGRDDVPVATPYASRTRETTRSRETTRTREAPRATPAPRPTPQPRPAPTTREAPRASRPTYTPSQRKVPTQLNRDAYSRQRATRSTTRSTTRSAPSRGGRRR